MPKAKKSRYKNDVFLKALGRHCRQLRMRKGYSIDRLTKESDQLSAGTIDRLERGLSDSQILVLVRYAEALNLSLFDLFEFLRESPELSLYRDARVIPYEEGVKPPAKHVPVFPLKVAAGKFAEGTEIEELIPIGWVEAPIKADVADYFASYVKGDSMSPKINDGDLVLFKKYTGGSRQGHVFLIQARGLKDVVTGESFVIKKYQRITPPRQSEDDEPSVVHLLSENPKYPPIILMGATDEDVQVLAEFTRVL